MITTYLIKSTLCLAVLFGFYKIVLEAKALHHFKRYYLLASLIFSLTIPLITFTYTTSEAPQEIWIGEFAHAWDQVSAPVQSVPIEEKTNYLPYILWAIYGLGTLIFGGRFLLNLIRLKRKITTAETLDRRHFTLALLQQSIIPHSFLKYIFLSRKRYENKEIPTEVIAHEATHVRQKHSLDILFIEFLQVVFWFNPLFWMTKKSITLNHEFLADQGAIQKEHDIYQYQHILLNYASSAHHTTLESPFNYSSTKKRILMLSQSFNRKRLAISALLLIPIIVGCVLVFNQGIIAQPNNDLAIEGHWIDHANENQDVFIYEEDGTLWWDQKVVKAPITVKDGNYFLPSGNLPDSELWELSIADNGFLKLGDSTYFTPPEDTVSYRIDGIWSTPDGETKYHFITKNGGPTCDVINTSTNKSTRYYPNLVDNGMEFTIGNDWHTFTFDNGKLTMQDGTELKRIENHSVYKTHTTNEDVNYLNIEIIDNDNYTINDIPATNATLMTVLESFNTNNTKEERQQLISATISEPKPEQQDQVDMLHNVLYEYGVKEVQVYMGNIFPNTTLENSLKEKHPTKQDLKRWLDTNQYGIWINGVKVSNEVLTAYQPDDIPYFTESTIEKNTIDYGKYDVQVNLMTNTYWREKGGYPEGHKEYLEKFLEKNQEGNSQKQNIEKEAFEAMYNQTKQNYAKEFVEGAERNGEKGLVIEIRKNTVRVNGKPSSLATLRSDIDAITRDWSATDYAEAFPSTLVKNPAKGFIKKLNEEFLKTNFSKANGGMDLVPPPPPPPPAPGAPEAQLPPPPPPPSVEDHLKSMNDIGGVFYYEDKQVTFEKAVSLVKANENLNVQTRHPYTNAPKTYISAKPIVVETQKQSKKPVSKKDISVYNKLAKKYGKNPNGEILKTEVAFMYEIYSRMTKTQKKNAEPYPALPPPPPPAPVKVKTATPNSGQKMAAIKSGDTIPIEIRGPISARDTKFFYQGKALSTQEALDYLSTHQYGIKDQVIKDEVTYQNIFMATLYKLTDKEIQYNLDSGIDNNIYASDYERLKKKTRKFRYNGKELSVAEGEKLLLARPTIVTGRRLAENEKEITILLADI
ncbi:M56 family metallopeptidase [uncultured Dokdonia sp.]|uniref:M56 family metallopeptidase n=1 Tax=uncultured Dokdonia sp. TaxID=575653 RepID=UPI00262068E1|nr:M56 family metallopeptidase [uncultured Dokdonia sp.]